MTENKTISVVVWTVAWSAFALGLLIGICFPAIFPPRTVQQSKEASFDDLLDAIEWVESREQSDAVGDNGNAVGAYQIWKIYVDDVNRILGKNKYSYDDRWDRTKSRQMVTIYLKHYGGTFEEMARKHNGGPKGHKKASTEGYWAKIKERMEKP